MRTGVRNMAYGEYMYEVDIMATRLFSALLAQRVEKFISLLWRHNGHDSISNHQPYDCLLNRLFRRGSKKTSKLRVTGLCVGNSPGPVNSPHKWPVTRKMFPFDDVIMYKWGGMWRFGGYWVVHSSVPTVTRAIMMTSSKGNIWDAIAPIITPL